MIQNKIPGKFVIGLTGPTGSGKSTIAEILSKNGCHTIIADSIVHKIMEPGQSVYKKIITAFGNDIVGENLNIDRKKLGSIVFNNQKDRTKLENIIHPVVIDKIINEVKKCKPDIVVVEAILLVESNLHLYCDVVWLVTASEIKRKDRIISRDGIDESTAEARMRNQRDLQPIMDIADCIIYNDSDIQNLREQTLSCLHSLKIK